MNSSEREFLWDALKAAREISKLDNDETVPDIAQSYARALGRANGIAAGMVLNIETVLRVAPNEHHPECRMPSAGERACECFGRAGAE